MRNHSTHAWKSAFAKVLVAIMVLLSVAVIPTTTIKAATAPTLTKSSRNILVGSTYDLNVKNKIAKSTYKWTTSDKKIAKVDNKGIVTGIKKGTAVITCAVKTSKKTYKLTCKVTVVKPAVVFRIKNKVSALNLGQVYDLNRFMGPSTSNDKTTWTSSDTTIAAPDKNGVFTALKEGSVTITGKTLSGKTDSITVNVVDKAGTVTTQKELDALLGSGVELITIKTAEEVDFTIDSGDYSNTKLVVEAPKADVYNNGVFASIDIKQIAANSWYENAIGNLLNILATDSRIVVGPNAKVKIEVTVEGVKLKIENNGVVEELVVNKAANINISGTSTKEIPVVINVPNISITTSVPLNLSCNEKMELVLLAGAEKTKVQAKSEAVVPTIKGSITIKVVVGTGDTAKEQEVKPIPVGSSTPSTGGNSGTGTGTTPTPTYSKTFVLEKSLADITGINVSYAGKAYTISSTTLDTLMKMLNSEALYIDLWRDTTKTTNTYDGQTVTVTGTKGDATKVVTFTGGQLDGRSYTATYNPNGSVTISSNTTKVSFTVSKGNDLKTLVISGDQTKLAGVTFTIKCGNTYILEKSYTELSSIEVSYSGQNYSVSSGMLSILEGFLSKEDIYLTVWKNTEKNTQIYDGQTVTVEGKAGESTKTVTFKDGDLNNKSYTVTVNDNHSVTVKNNTSNVSFTIEKGTDNKSLTITNAPSSLVFAPTYK